LVNYLRGHDCASARAAAYYDEIGRDGGITQTKVAEIFEISQPALSKALKRRNAGPAKPRGPPNYLDLIQQDSLNEWIRLKLADLNAPSINEIRLQAWEITRRSGDPKPKIPSRRWVKIWMKQRGFVLARAKIRTHTSLYINPEQVSMFLKNYTVWLENNGNDPNRIWNFDETGVAINCLNSRLMVATLPEVKNPIHRGGKLQVRVTLGVCGSASGLSTKVQLILPDRGWKRLASSTFIPTKTKLIESGRGWQNKSSFRWWIEEIFIPDLGGMSILGKKRILLIVDGHNSRRAEGLLPILQMNKIDVLVLPANSSKYLQPLDQVAFGTLKRTISASEEPITKLEFLDLLEDCLGACLKRSTIRASWKRANLVPFNEDDIDAKIPYIDAPSSRRRTHLMPLGGRFLSETL